MKLGRADLNRLFLFGGTGAIRPIGCSSRPQRSFGLDATGTDRRRPLRGSVWSATLLSTWRLRGARRHRGGGRQREVFSRSSERQVPITCSRLSRGSSRRSKIAEHVLDQAENVQSGCLVAYVVS